MAGGTSPTGAQALVGTLVAAGVDTCFANPGTSEMHFVAALDAVAGLRPVLGLAEGAVTGAADGYGRIAGRPAAALLHLGPGLANGVSNLHNARRAHTPVIAVVGDHATFHKRLDAPLESDIDALAGTVSCWVRRSWRPEDVGPDAAAAVAAARRAPGGVATLVLPADASWSPGGRVADPQPVQPAAPPGDAAVAAAAAALRAGEPAAVLIGGAVAADPGAQALAAGLAAATGATLLCETFPARMARGAGRPRIGRLAYLGEMAAAQLRGARHLVLLGARRPAAFFAYPGRPGDLTPEGAAVHELAPPGTDAVEALAALAAALGITPPAASGGEGVARPARPSGPIEPASLAAAVGATLPDDAIVVDESISASFGLGSGLAGAAPHDLLTLTGGSIGFGLPCATGAAVAGGGRPVVCLEGDGSAVYTLPALWTQAREGLDVTTVIVDNGAYAILAMELDRLEAGTPGPGGRSLLDLSGPSLDFVALARGFGVPATRATTAEELAAQLEAAHAEPGPHLVDAVMTPAG
ncbi:MAG TPA: acetolactate synthase large subunit [Acidimicrobiales bacterium]|nr:acetolactate synthase large subunit [Acidimicrobiales bacterium]